ncbi:Glycosyltransferase sugar-binding region containing DXD motif-containing protein [Reichenbachiella faecimaris]|uniref:Glycosyltransferase sugar-binding region containing DXD motif-containing protein n=1 Tax=Reichenbachiella faecimaris TaxID=692418 RepID=A0A1W2GJ17_REIFA|nr:glycosyltransferase [Reichenbachiella faecimaris]SMD36472.1 Glycosyltransferase sugar-binding region containing DXD motif-containing protein [Reichenbachiella faecimaris]
MIPKILHYCWYGPNELSELNKRCIESWKTIMPEYEIMKWDETNSKMDLPFMKGAYKKKRFGYLIDHTRLYALSKHGGIFLDLDFMALQSFNRLLDHTFFLGMIKEEEVGMGIIGCETNNPHILQIMKVYEDLDKFQDIPSTAIATNYFKSQNLHANFNSVENDVAFYPKEFFYNYTLSHAFHGENYKKYIHPDSIAIHLWENTWIKPEFRDFWFGEVRRGYTRAIKRIIRQPFQGVGYYKDLTYHVLRHLGFRK